MAALICCVVDFGIAQFGLLNLIQKAYSGIAYLAIPVILIPYIVHMVVTRFDPNPPHERNRETFRRRTGRLDDTVEAKKG